MLDESGEGAGWPRDDGSFEEINEAMWPHADDDEAA
jgi:hypothetical protein